MVVGQYLTSDVDSDMGMLHNSPLTLAWSSDNTLSSKAPLGHVYMVALGPQDSEFSVNESWHLFVSHVNI